MYLWCLQSVLQRMRKKGREMSRKIRPALRLNDFESLEGDISEKGAEQRPLRHRHRHVSRTIVKCQLEARERPKFVSPLSMGGQNLDRLVVR